VGEIEIGLQELKQKQKDVMARVYKCTGMVYRYTKLADFHSPQAAEANTSMSSAALTATIS
jgi:hypothetical protein